MKITLKPGLCQEPSEGDERAKGEELIGWTIQMGTCPPAGWHQVCLVIFPADFLRWHEQFLNEERDPGTQQWTKSPQEVPSTRDKEAVPYTDVTVNHLGPKGDRGMGVGIHIPRPMSEWRFQSWLHLKSLGNFGQGT